MYAPAQLRTSSASTTGAESGTIQANTPASAPGSIPQFSIGSLSVHPPGSQAGLADRYGLPARLKAGIERLSGQAMDDVRVHRHSPRPGAIGAHAFARGTEIHLAPGQEHHLPHEAWHVAQQKQGRVPATMRLATGIAINDDAGLEAEADRMGARAAIGMPVAGPAPAPASQAAAAAAPLQAVWVVRDGKWKWIDPKDRQDADRTPPEFTQQPELILEKGKKSLKPDASGTLHTAAREKPQKYAEIKKRREDQGRAHRQRLLADPGKISSQTQELRDLAGRLERAGSASLPKNHEKKVAAATANPPMVPDDFRDVHGGQDEFTQSSASAGFLTALGTSTHGESDDHRKLLADYHQQAARVMSSLRGPTQAIVAAVDHKGKTTGSQHSTTSDQPKLDHGGSGHAYNDRARAQQQADVFDAASADPGAPANAVFNAANFGATLATLHRMSWPTKAANLAAYNKSRADEQVGERDTIKVQANVVGRTLGVVAPNDEQQPDALFRSWPDRPTSPLRTRQAVTAFTHHVGVSPAVSGSSVSSGSASSATMPSGPSSLGLATPMPISGSVPGSVAVDGAAAMSSSTPPAGPLPPPGGSPPVPDQSGGPATAVPTSGSGLAPHGQKNAHAAASDDESSDGTVDNLAKRRKKRNPSNDD